MAPKTSGPGCSGARTSGPVGLSEADLVARLRARYAHRPRPGVADSLRYVHAAHVRNVPTFPTAIADFLVLDTWRGTWQGPGYPVTGFEIKTSRGDWLRELKKPGKSQWFRSVCTTWFLVVSDPGIVRDDLPEGWGLMVPRGAGLAVRVQPEVNLAPEPMPPAMLAGFTRAAVTQATAAATRASVADGSGTAAAA